MERHLPLPLDTIALQENSSSSASSEFAGPLVPSQQGMSCPQQLPDLPQLRIRTLMPTSVSPQAARAVEMSSRQLASSTQHLGGASPSSALCWDELETSSDEIEHASYASARGSAAGASPDTWGAAAGAFEPFAVEEQATELKYLREMYGKKDRECEHLRQIIKELSQSRAKVQKTKVEMEEQFVALQKEYFRVTKVSELARTVSQQAVSRSTNLKGELAAAQDQARRSRRRAAAAEARAASLADENVKLRQQLALLQQLRLSQEDVRTSACAREYLYAHSMNLY